MVMPTGIQQRTLDAHPGLEEALKEHGIDPHCRNILKPGSKEYKTYNALKIRARGIEYRTYKKWKEHARLDGLDIPKDDTKGGWANIQKGVDFRRFKQQCFDDLEKDKDGNYMCPICTGENAHPLIVQPYEEILKYRDEMGFTVSKFSKEETRRQRSAKSHKKKKLYNNIHAWTPSVDKIHDHLPHTMDNVQVICWKMNKHKGNLTLSELQDLGNWAENREIDESSGYHD
tara:strand:- start:422 stop:1111 length:690 start_codon:yes stop_codon:yes gene_type:complete